MRMKFRCSFFVSMGLYALLALHITPLAQADDSISTDVAAMQHTIAGLVRGQLEQQLARQGMAGASMTLDVVVNPRIGLPACPVLPEVAAQELRYFSRMVFQVSCPGEKPWQQAVVIRAKVKAPVLVAAANLPSGHRVDHNDLILAPRDIVLLDNDMVTDSSRLEGLETTRRIPQGQPVLATQVRQPLMVRQGDSLRLVLTGQPDTGGATSVEALESGRVGDIIRVKVSPGQSVLRVRIQNKTEVSPADL